MRSIGAIFLIAGTLEGVTFQLFLSLPLALSPREMGEPRRFTMKRHISFALFLAALTAMNANVFAQSTDHPTRPTESFGQSGNRPDSVPQRPSEAFGQRGERPADAGAQRPADSYGQRGQRPDNAPQRPSASHGRRGSR